MRVPRRDGVAAHLEIDASKAAVVRRIFDMYVKQGLTVRQIAKQLTLGGTPAPSGGRQWSWAMIDRVLHDEAYIGTFYHNRYNCVTVEGVPGQKRPSVKCTLRPSTTGSQKQHSVVELFCGIPPFRARPTRETLRGIYRGPGESRGARRPADTFEELLQRIAVTRGPQEH